MTYAEEVQVHEILRVDVEETHSEDRGEETHRVILTSCFDDLLALVWELAFIELRVGPYDLAVADV